jgi:hypothetical protein
MAAFLYLVCNCWARAVPTLVVNALGAALMVWEQHPDHCKGNVDLECKVGFYHVVLNTELVIQYVIAFKKSLSTLLTC